MREEFRKHFEGKNDVSEIIRLSSDARFSTNRLIQNADLTVDNRSQELTHLLNKYFSRRIEGDVYAGLIAIPKKKELIAQRITDLKNSGFVFGNLLHLITFASVRLDIPSVGECILAPGDLVLNKYNQEYMPDLSRFEPDGKRFLSMYPSGMNISAQSDLKFLIIE